MTASLFDEWEELDFNAQGSRDCATEAMRAGDLAGALFHARMARDLQCWADEKAAELLRARDQPAGEG